MSQDPEYPSRFGPYVLIDSLGEGGMGRVSLAITGTAGLETLCVIKRVLPHLLRDHGFVDRLRDEANVGRRLVHANLVQTHAVGEVDGEPFIAQEFIDGHDLEQVRHRCASDRVPLPVPVAIHLAAEAARGLAFAHDFEGLDLVHRDISPPNIRLAWSGDVKLLDFGLATSTLKTTATVPGFRPGKLIYMAPEQVRGAPLDRRADVYALGVVLWEMLARKRMGRNADGGPAAGGPETVTEAMERILRSEIPPPSQLNREVPAAVDRIVLRALARRPEDRFQRADELRADLLRQLPSGFDGGRAITDLLERLFNRDREREIRSDLVRRGRALLDPARQPVAGDIVSRGPSAPPPARDEATEIAPGVTASTSAGPMTSVTDQVSAPIGRRSRARIIAGIGGTVALLVVAMAWLAGRRQSEPPHSGPQFPPSRPTSAAVPSMAPPGPSWPREDPAGPEESPPGPPRTAQARAVRPPVPRPARPEVATATPSATPETPTPAQDPAALVSRARAAFREGDLDEALALGREAVDAGGGAPAHMVVANSLFKLRKLDEAEREYVQVLKLAPADTAAQERLDKVREMRGRGPE